jgi:hypothetical protein
MVSSIACGGSVEDCRLEVDVEATEQLRGELHSELRSERPS